MTFLRHIVDWVRSRAGGGFEIGCDGRRDETPVRHPRWPRPARRSWDLVLLDLSLPDRSGLETLRALRRLLPASPVLVMSFHPEADYAAAVRAAGAPGYVAKGDAPATLLDAVRGALACPSPS